MCKKIKYRQKNLFLLKLKQNESGAILIIVASAMAIFMALMALAIDVGLAYLNTGQLQKAADAAVYSAGRELPVAENDLTAQNAIKDSAIHYASVNGFNDLTRADVVLGNLTQNQYTAITVTASQTVYLNFARAIGIDTLDITRNATAKLSPIIKTTGAVPIGLTKVAMDEILSSGNLTDVVLKYGTKSGSSSGFFGALDLNGQGGGASDYRLWLVTGSPGEISVGDVLLEESGNMVGPTYQGFSERYNACTHFDAQTGGTGCTIEHYDKSCPRIAKIVVYEPGNKSVVVAGFAAFLLESQTQDGYITGSFLKTITNGTSSGDSMGENGEADFGLTNLVLSE